ncbi:MAG: hypothetical protein ACKOCW_10675 [Planctomycetaceae bacterium]
MGIDVGEPALVTGVGQSPVVGTEPRFARPRRRPWRREALVVPAWFAWRNATLAAGAVPAVDTVGARSSGVAGLVVVCRHHVAARRLAGHGGAIVAPSPPATAAATAAPASPAAAAVAFVALGSRTAVVAGPDAVAMSPGVAACPPIAVIIDAALVVARPCDSSVVRTRGAIPHGVRGVAWFVPLTVESLDAG